MSAAERARRCGLARGRSRRFYGCQHFVSISYVVKTDREDRGRAQRVPRGAVRSALSACVIARR